jgi:hypothetical protein
VDGHLDGGTATCDLVTAVAVRPRRRPLRPPPAASPTEKRERCGHEGEGGRRGGESTVATSPEPADARRRWRLRRISRRKRETRGRRQAGTGVLVGIRLGCNLLPKIQPTAIKSLCWNKKSNHGDATIFIYLSFVDDGTTFSSIAIRFCWLMRRD